MKQHMMFLSWPPGYKLMSAQIVLGAKRIIVPTINATWFQKIFKKYPVKIFNRDHDHCMYKASKTI